MHRQSTGMEFDDGILMMKMWGKSEKKKTIESRKHLNAWRENEKHLVILQMDTIKQSDIKKTKRMSQKREKPLWRQTMLQISHQRDKQL